MYRNKELKDIMRLDIKTSPYGMSNTVDEIELKWKKEMTWSHVEKMDN